MGCPRTGVGFKSSTSSQIAWPPRDSCVLFREYTDEERLVPASVSEICTAPPTVRVEVGGRAMAAKVEWGSSMSGRAAMEFRKTHPRFGGSQIVVPSSVRSVSPMVKTAVERHGREPNMWGVERHKGVLEDHLFVHGIAVCSLTMMKYQHVGDRRLRLHLTAPVAGDA